MQTTQAIQPPRTTSCGCCTDGCCCWNHRDEPMGRPVTVCAFHQTTPHPRTTSPIERTGFFAATECPRCGTDYGRGNHRCNLTDGSTLCYECTLDIHPPMAQTERERLDEWLEY